MNVTGSYSLIQVMVWCRQKPITWSNLDPDLCRHLASLGHNEFMLLYDITLVLHHKDKSYMFLNTFRHYFENILTNFNIANA